jgi:hypothetical protein
MPGGTEWHRYADFLTTIRTYVNAVSLLRQVEMVVLQGSTPDDARIWTVISAQPFDRMPRREVYEAQIEAQARAAEPLAEFRLLNVRELTIPLSSALPASYRVLYRS